MNHASLPGWTCFCPFFLCCSATVGRWEYKPQIGTLIWGPGLRWEMWCMQGAPMTFPSSLRRRTRDLRLVPVVSAPVEVDPSCRYDNLPHFSHFGDSISFVGGINKPKLIQCFDSAGQCHRQLVGCMSPCRGLSLLTHNSNVFPFSLDLNAKWSWSQSIWYIVVIPINSSHRNLPVLLALPVSVEGTAAGCFCNARFQVLWHMHCSLVSNVPHSSDFLTA